MPSDQSFEKLTDGNYVEWKMYIDAKFVKKDLKAVVDGLERHPGGNEGTKKVKEYYRKMAEARAEIILNVSPSQLAHCRNEDPYQIMLTLANVHLPRGRSTILALRRRFHRLRLERSEVMSAFVSRVRHVAFLLGEAGVTVSDDDVILVLTAGLPHSYDNLLVSLDSLPDSEYTLPTVISRLNNEYQRQHMYSNPTPRAMSTTSPDPTPTDEAMSVMPSSSRLANITCFSCGNRGHYQSNCPSRSAPASAPSPAPTVQSQGHAAFAEIWSDDESY